MLIHPNVDPVAIHLGPLAVRWYGLMYLVAFIAAIVVGRLRLRLPHVVAQGWTTKDVADMLFYGVAGPVLRRRARLWPFYQARPFLPPPPDSSELVGGGGCFFMTHSSLPRRR